MHIDAVDLYHVRLPLKTPFEASMTTMRERDVILVKVQAGDLYGWGEASPLNDPYYNEETPHTAWHILRDYLAPLLLRYDVERPEDAAQLFRHVRAHHFAKAGLENAVWDLMARRANLPLATLLGGTKTAIEVGVSVGIQPSPAHLTNTVGAFLNAGYHRVKIKIKPGRDLDDLRAVRDAYPNARLMADANSAYTLDHRATFEALDELDLMMFEQPLAWDDIVDHATLQRWVRTPVCLDESVRTPDDARKALQLGACKTINIKVGRVAGHTAARAIHDLMRQHDLPVWCGGMMETGIGRAHNLHLTTLPGFTLPGDTSASDRYYQRDLVDHPATLNPDGTLSVPDRPGIGVDVDPDALDHYCLTHLRLARGA